MLIDLGIGLLLSSVIGFLAYKKRSLSASGLIASVIFGTLIYYWGTFLVWIALIGFFISSSILTKIHEKKDSLKINTDKKGRNYIQVISNALVATIFSALYYYLNKEIFLIASVVSIATSNADTWASEIGILSKGKTFSILNFKVMPKGVSGAVSSLGLVASALGGLFIAILFASFYGILISYDLVKLFTFAMIITFGGFLGALIDSYLGIIFQAKYKGSTSGTIYEVRRIKHEKAILISGFAMITNDAVNLLSGLFSSIITVLFFTV